MKKLIYFTVVSISFLNLAAQQDFVLYNMQEIPQSTYSNPSNQFNGKFYIGLPGLSSNYFSFTNSDFAYSNAIKKSGDSLSLDFNSILDKVNDDNYFSFNTRTDLLSLGYTLSPSTQVTFSITENANFRMNYTEDFVTLIYKGNAGFDDNTANFEGVGLSLNHYREYSFGLSHQLNEKWRVGGKFKYLYGMENIYSERTDISLVTDPETFELTFLADISIKTAGIDQVDEKESVRDYLMKRKNRGMAFDLGANYQLNEKLSLNASVLDLGFIRWRKYTKSYSNNGEEFQYNGIALDAFADEEESTATDDSETSFDRVLDSLEKSLNIDTAFGSYTSPLTGRFYIGANYKINERSMAGALIQSEIFQRKIIPSITFSYNRKMTKWISLTGSYTIKNGSFTNLGLGVNVNPGPVQLYMVTDNILGVFQPQHYRYLQIRFGINLIFGGNKSIKLNPTYIRSDKNSEESNMPTDDTETDDSVNE